MRLLVDAIPTDPLECLYSAYVVAVDSEVLEELEENEDVEYCDDCGGVKVSDEYKQEIFVCHLMDDRCAVDEGDECPFLATGYVTKF